MVVWIVPFVAIAMVVLPAGIVPIAGDVGIVEIVCIAGVVPIATVARIA